MFHLAHIAVCPLWQNEHRLFHYRRGIRPGLEVPGLVRPAVKWKQDQILRPDKCCHRKTGRLQSLTAPSSTRLSTLTIADLAHTSKWHLGKPPELFHPPQAYTALHRWLRFHPASMLCLSMTTYPCRLTKRMFVRYLLENDQIRHNQKGKEAQLEATTMWQIAIVCDFESCGIPPLI